MFWLVEISIDLVSISAGVLVILPFDMHVKLCVSPLIAPSFRQRFLVVDAHLAVSVAFKTMSILVWR